jgi:FlaA1/EpsC-like NDP-sugar epimerase
MGEPVRIVDLARDIARLAGRDPDAVPIEFIGLRPGEKLHEELFYSDESAQPTRHPKVLRVDAPVAGDGDVLDLLEALVAVGARGDHELARRQLGVVLERLQPTGERVPS